ncbi:uncharacterized protein F5147DRAFT_435447 [Suillus discolor]|uniref:Uncharacterized protein n=1 Tax=Suillus discolor TaxID=1912936 RepID=A0A9P7EV36_9AGAM|nr:uncharacterized protein F5147DRAFT_435447 [Suillus discolor]KAG2091967.1 hypothetical protein F5147DRAFT_435447 [Suillus discolor]
MTGDRKLRHITTADWSAYKQYTSRVQVLGDMNSNLFGGIVVHAMIGFLRLTFEDSGAEKALIIFMHAYVAARVLASGRFVCVWYLRKKISGRISCFQLYQVSADTTFRSRGTTCDVSSQRARSLWTHAPAGSITTLVQ